MAGTLFATRLDRLASRIAPSRGIILALHRLAENVGDGPLNGLEVGLGEFRQCLDLLSASGFEIVSMQEAMKRLAAPGKAPRFAVLTFDDGYRDNYDLLLPELCRRHIPAVIYLTTGFADRTAPMWWYGIEALLEANGAVEVDGERLSDYSALQAKLHAVGMPVAVAALERRYEVDFRTFTDRNAMTWAMVREALATGLVEIGAHGDSHLALAGLGEGAARHEMEMSARRVREETGGPVDHFAFPYGDRASVSARDAALARACGFATAVTSISGLIRSNRVDRHALRRVVLGGRGMPDRLRLALSGLVGEPPIVGPA